LRILVVVSILVVPVAIAAALVWQAESHPVTARYVIGVGMLVLGAACLALHLTLSDDFLRRHFVAPGADEMRRFLRRWWIGVLLGAALLGLHYVDRWVEATAAEARFKVAFNRGLSAARSRDWPTATEAYSEAIRLDPSDARAYRHRGAAYLHLGDQDRALADFDEVLRLAPDDALSLYNRGIAWFRKNDLDRALADFEGAIRLDPNYAKAYLGRSRVHDKKGDGARARADL
jgi:tetratricopeptide (TPR) repeat protein